jgi:hypothetical protein
MMVFSRDCGATTGFNSQGSILRAGKELPDEAGNVFSTDKDEVTVRWSGPDRVVVRLKGAGSDFWVEKQFHGITIVYE